MATNGIKQGKNLSCPVPTDTASGASVRIGGATGRNGVTLTAEGEGFNDAGYATVTFEGVFELSVTGAVTTFFQPIYIVAADNTLTTTSTDNTLFGNAVTLKSASGAGAVEVRIQN